MKKILRLAIAIIAFALLWKIGSVSAATFYLDPPSGGNIIKGCNTSIKVRMSTEGLSSNGAQAYVGYTSLGGGTISISGGGIFSTYGTPPGVPASTRGIFGYGGIVTGSGLNFANLNINSNLNGPLTLTFLYEAGDITSKIAQHPSSENILTGVTNATYNVIDGYCETVPPYLTNLDPVPDKPNHPVGQNIKFDIKDDSSGLNMSTFVVTVKQNDVDVPFNITKTPNGTGDKWYLIDIDPISDLIPELKVVVTVSASDKAGNSMTRTYQFNDLTCAQLGCSVSAITPQCSDGADNDSDGKIDFPEDTGCLTTDDNNEFLTGDCATGATSTCGIPITPQCSDGVDNDGDGLIDLADSNCTDSNDNNELGLGEIPCPFVTTTPATGGGTISINNLRFFLANRSVETAANASNVVETMAKITFTVAADLSGITDTISEANLVLGDRSYEMYYDNGLGRYAVDVMDLADPGTLNSAVIVDHGSGSQESIPFTLSVLPKGIVQTKDDSAPVPQATVRLEQRNGGGQYVLISNVTTDSRGEYGFIVPNGIYRLTVQKDGFKTEQSAGFEVSNHIINRVFNLVREVDLLDASIPVTEKISYLADTAESQAAKIIASADDPAVEAVAQNAVAPIAIGAAVAATLPALSLLNLLSYLRYLFLQPIFLFGWRKRKKWGVVYNALSRMPIDLAIVRLINVNTGAVVQSRVTDGEGRYAFFAEPGLYRMEVTKDGFIFPTKMLQELKEDGRFVDIYHGEPVHVDDKYTAITANIPLDPVEAPEKTPARIVWEQRLRALQRFIASLSIAAGILAVIITPTWWTIGLLVLQILLYFLFKRLATPGKPKNWGIVYDMSNKKPIGKAVARLFSKQFNKLVSTEITDNNGRYSFMVGPNDYYITFERNGYQKATSPGISIKEKHEVVKVDVGMKKFGAGQAPEPPKFTPPSAESVTPLPVPSAVPPVVKPPESSQLNPPPAAPVAPPPNLPVGPEQKLAMQQNESKPQIERPPDKATPTLPPLKPYSPIKPAPPFNPPTNKPE